MPGDTLRKLAGSLTSGADLAAAAGDHAPQGSQGRPPKEVKGECGGGAGSLRSTGARASFVLNRQVQVRQAVGAVGAKPDHQGRV